MADLILFHAGGRAFTRDHVLAAADRRGDLQQLRTLVRTGFLCQQYGQDEEFELAEADLQSASDDFRAERNLTAAEDTERWLGARDLAFDDLVAWLERRAWRERLAGEVDKFAADYTCDDDEVEAALWPEVVFGNHLASLTRALAERVAAWVATKHAADGWADDLQSMEQAHADACREVTAAIDIRRELAADATSFTHCEVEFAGFPSVDVAREALLCVTTDGEALEDVAARGGVEMRRERGFPPELPDSIRSRVLDAAPGDVVGPFEDAGGFIVMRVSAKTAPDPADPDVRGRVEAVTIARTLDQLEQRHVRWEEVARDDV